MRIKSTKSFHKLACAHMQYFDSDASGVICTGPCSKWHGYDRSVTFEFSGDPDAHGWIVGFGDLKPVRSFLEFYFDHTAVAPADDPRMAAIMEASAAGLVDLRILPHGVSMEMSSLFIWERVNPFIMDVTKGRVFVSKVECREHDSNSAFIEMDETVAKWQWRNSDIADTLAKRATWNWESPADAFARLKQAYL